MTRDERNAAIMELIKQHTVKCQADPEYARRSLIEEGFTNPNGTLHKNYGGRDNG